MTSVLRDDLGNYADLVELPSEADVAGELRALNELRGADTPCLWQLTTEYAEDPDWGRGPAIWLDAGIGGSVGALRWVERGRSFVPASGADRLYREDDWLPYYDFADVECSIRGAMQVPIEQVFTAVAEVTRTHRRPTSLDWLEVENRRWRLVGPRVTTDKR